MRIVVSIAIMAGWLAATFLQAAETVGPGMVMTSVQTLPRTGQISTYDQTGKLIDFQGSGQDGEFQRGVVWPEPRFIVNGDGTVSDSLTGLMWLKDGNCFGDLPWPTALQMVVDFNKNNALCHGFKTDYQDWFLPDINQLATLFDAQVGVTSDYLRLGGFTSLQRGIYWSATAYLNRLNAWGANFTNGSIASHNKLERHFLLIARVEKAEKTIIAKVGARPVAPESVPALTQSGQRFVDNGDGTVTDGLTGLMWLQDASCLSTLDWQGALAAMQLLNGGPGESGCPSLSKKYSDWSLPNAIELRSLIDYEADYPALSSGHPFKAVAASGYWTATTATAIPEQAFMVDLDTGAMSMAPKTAKHHALPVRQVVPPPLDRPRKESGKGGSLGVAEQYLLALDPEMPSEIHWPPGPRFFNNGDGTSMDSITGVNWLTDANCFGKKSWKEAAAILKNFNSRPKTFKCAEYEAGVDDWQLPTLVEMSDLVNKDEENREEWLNQQGVKNVQGSAYWTATENPLNLYFADAIILKTAKAGNYPKSLRFFIWPKRKAQKGKEPNEPLLNLTANAISDFVTLSPKDPLSLVVYLHTFGLRRPADFWFWYDTPDEKRLWLTPIRTWTDKVTSVYQGPLFNLKTYEIYRAGANGLAPGVYDFHFAVDTIPNGIFDEPRYEVKVSVVIPDGQ